MGRCEHVTGVPGQAHVPWDTLPTHWYERVRWFLEPQSTRKRLSGAFRALSCAQACPAAVDAPRPCGWSRAVYLSRSWGLEVLCRGPCPVKSPPWGTGGRLLTAPLCSGGAEGVSGTPSYEGANDIHEGGALIT